EITRPVTPSRFHARRDWVFAGRRTSVGCNKVWVCASGLVSLHISWAERQLSAWSLHLVRACWLGPCCASEQYATHFAYQPAQAYGEEHTWISSHPREARGTF
uniref:Uncharacterized protein n=1 Tax=Nothoprocta perdicaria TaxID=30464 RepID=A0A8C6YSH1_NOTPE